MATKIRRKTGLLLIGTLIFFLGAAAVSQAEQGAQGEMSAAQKKRAMITAAKKALDNTDWQITLKEMTTNKKNEDIKDTLSFTNGKVESKEMTSKGFSPTNFTVKIKDKDIIAWETMQTSEGGGVAFWRGEIEKGVRPCVMSGVLSWHVDKKITKDYMFVSEKKETALMLKEDKGKR